MAISYGKMVIIGAGKVGSAILNSVLRMNILDEIVVVNRNQKKALGEVLDASHTTAFAYSANANIHVGGYEECADAQIIVVTAGPSIQPGNSRDRMVLLEKNVNVMNDIMEQITRYTREAIIIVVSNPLDILTYIYTVKQISLTLTLLEICEVLQMTPEEVEIQRQKGYIRFTTHKGMTVYEITDLLRLKNMLEMGNIYRKIDAKAMNIEPLNNE